MGGAFLKSLAFGIAIAASIGPIALLIISHAANRGLLPGSFAGLGAALADLVYALLAFSAGALLLPLLESWAPAIRTGSALVLIVLAIIMFRRDLAGAGDRTATARHPAGSLLPTFLLTLVNPMTLVMFAGFAPQLPLAGSLATAGRGWRRAINLAGAAGVFAFGVARILAAR
jgi:threonine/homoserine/homoserine lactone efflux protein